MMNKKLGKLGRRDNVSRIRIFIPHTASCLLTERHTPLAKLSLLLCIYTTAVEFGGMAQVKMEYVKKEHK